MTSAPASHETALPARPPKVRLGEELPIFCEKCGYSLHGLPPVRCEKCDVLQFHCPECGHHQPINTLRPAFQKLLGRATAVLLVCVVLAKGFTFFLCYLGWWAAGYANTAWYYYNWQNVSSNTITIPELRTIELNWGTIAAFVIFGLAFGMVGRMMMMRWRRGYVVGAVLAGLVVLTVIGGAAWRRADLTEEYHTWDPNLGTMVTHQLNLPPMWTTGFLIVLAITFAAVAVGATIVFGLWSGVVRLLLPSDRAQALLDWQRGLSSRSAALAR